MLIIDMVRNAFKHVGSGKNVNLLSLARNVAPCYLPGSTFAFTPLTIFISINSDCNLRCKMCDIGQRNLESSFYKNLKLQGGHDKLDLDRLREVITELSGFRPVPRISVTTTEPLLYKGLFDIAGLVTGSGMEFQVTTNGAVLDRYLEDVFDSGVTELCISVDGKGALHDEIRGMEGLYGKIIGNLEWIRAAKKERKTAFPKITLATTVSNFNYDRLYELVDDIDESLYDRIIISHMNFIDEGMVGEHNRDFRFVGEAEMAGLPGETDNYKVDVAKLSDEIDRIKARYPKVHYAPDYDRGNLDTFYNKPGDFVWNNRCYIPWFVMEILANGDVIPLTRCIHIKMGNIYDSSVREIWNGPRYRKLRRELKMYKRFPICRRCRGIL